MTTPKAIVLRAAGTNCDRETEYALQQAGFQAERVHAFRLMERPERLGDCQFLVIPGGFSYGDDVAAGTILANQMVHRLADALNRFVDTGKLVLGVCNGFQVLLKSGLLPGGRIAAGQTASGSAHDRSVTLAWNDSGRFEDRWVHLRCDSPRCVFLPAGEIITLPVAHGEGKFVTRDEGVLAGLREREQIALRYVDTAGNTGRYPVNPNGSVDDVAGICDETGRVLGLMPHPERFIEVTQHPQWTRGDIERADGRLIFARAREHLESA